MGSRKQKRRGAMFNKKLQLLRSLTKSHANDDNSIILDASRYIKDLKHKIEILNQDIASAESSNGSRNPVSEITVEEQENVFLVKIFDERNCQGLLVFILEAFEEVGLEVLQARVSSAHSFLLEAAAAKENKEADRIDAEVVKQVMTQAIQNWSELN